MIGRRQELSRPAIKKDNRTNERLSEKMIGTWDNMTHLGGGNCGKKVNL